jgi:hypothetical protein
MVWGSKLSRIRRFISSKYSDWLWDPPSLLFNRYWVLLLPPFWGKAAVA